MLPGQDTEQVEEGWIERFEDDDELSATYLEIRGIEDPERGDPIRDDFDTHLSAVDRNGNGGHNHHNQIASLDQQGATYTVNVTNTPGMHHITGEFTKPDGTVVPINKATYDPSYFSDAQMNEMARDAGRIGWERHGAGDAPSEGRIDRSPAYDVDVGGVRFRVWLNIERGTGRLVVGNVHPIP